MNRRNHGSAKNGITPPHPPFWHAGDMNYVHATFNKKGVNSTVLEDQNHFWGNVHKFRVTGHLYGSYAVLGENYHTFLPLPPFVGLTYKTP